MNLGKKIAQIRTAKGITQAFVADSIGIDQSVYSRLEKSATDNIHFGRLCKICTVLDITVAELIETKSFAQKNKKTIAQIKEEIEIEDQIRKEGRLDCFLIELKDLEGSVRGLKKRHNLSDYEALKIVIDIDRNMLFKRAFIESHHAEIEPIHMIAWVLEELEQKAQEIKEMFEAKLP